MRVRQATVRDVSEMARLRVDDAEAGPADPRMEAYLRGAHHPRGARPPRVAYLAYEGDELAGYIAGHLSNRFGSDGELQYLYVARERRRSGAATALLKDLARWFLQQGARRICVDVLPGNLAARYFYKRHGAVELKPSWLVWEEIGSVLEENAGV